MEPAINQVHKLLIKNKKTVAVAESCTGGLLSNFLTQLPGSSKYFILGVVVYSNKTKENILTIPANVIAKKGAVSKNVAELLAKSVRLIVKADFGIGVTGIAGPGGGSKEKPVGTVFIAIDTKNNKICKKFNFTGSRSTIRKKAALKALELLKFIFTQSSV
ncbi:MAG: CinA family protein [Candidatus Omnitrophota bacterium]|nr:CinA family protein [Candidatus Omnitrophota bacterium]